MGTPGLCQTLTVGLDRKKEGAPPSLMHLPGHPQPTPAPPLARPKQQASSGEISHCASWLFLHLVSAWAPHPGRLPHKWEGGSRPGPAGVRVLRQAVPALVSASLCTWPLPPACRLEGPNRLLISGCFLSSLGPVAPGDKLTALSLAYVCQSPHLLCTRTFLPLPYVIGQTTEN